MSKLPRSPIITDVQEQVEVAKRPLLAPVSFVGKFTSGAVTPSVLNVDRWQFINTNPLTVTNFLQGQEGQHIKVLGDGFTTIQNNTNIKTNTGADVLLASTTVYSFTRFNNVWYQDGGAGSSSGSGGTTVASAPTRDTLTITTASLAASATANGLVDFGSNGVELYTIRGQNCRVRFYASSTARTADAGRPLGTVATAGLGILAEFAFGVLKTIECAPVPFLYDDDGIDGKICYAITNNAGAPAVVTVDLTYLPVES
jgi:hypothetical protein